MSRKYSQAARAALGKNGFVAHCRALLESIAWRTRPINTRRLLEFLELEHMKHGGRENGELRAPYNELVAFGIGRRFIRAAIDDAIARGLLEITHRGGLYPGRNADPSRYRLTYLQWVLRGANGPYWLEPADEWRAYKPPPKQQRRRKPTLRVVITND